MRLLLVVDGGLVRSAYCAVFSARGLHFDVASSPADGLARMRREAYDVIISDLKMAGMSGIDFLKAVREIDLGVPIVLMTDSPTVETATQAVEYGVCQYVSRSVGIDVLEETLRRAERWHALRDTCAESHGPSEAVAAVPISLAISPDRV
jgi:DNA-binding NtrC family response regulator